VLQIKPLPLPPEFVSPGPEQVVKLLCGPQQVAKLLCDIPRSFDAAGVVVTPLENSPIFSTKANSPIFSNAVPRVFSGLVRDIASRLEPILLRGFLQRRSLLDLHTAPVVVNTAAAMVVCDALGAPRMEWGFARDRRWAAHAAAHNVTTFFLGGRVFSLRVQDPGKWFLTFLSLFNASKAYKYAKIQATSSIRTEFA